MFPRFFLLPRGVNKVLRWLAVTLALGSPLAARTVLVDFGPNNGTDGDVTPSGTPAFTSGHGNAGNGSTGVADANGNYWNNAIAAGNTGGPLALHFPGLIDTTNAATPYGLRLGPNWKSNGKLNGGLPAPSSALLGNLAIAQATQDYFFVEGSVGTTATLQLTGLDPGRLYNLRLFGTRNATDTRRSTYTVYAGNGVFSTTLQTSGTGIGAGGYNGNNDTLAEITGTQPDRTGQLALTVTVAESTFAYLALLELTEGAAVPPVAASHTWRVDFGHNDNNNGHLTASPDSFGEYWNNFDAPGSAASGASRQNLVTITNAPSQLGLTLTSGWSSNGRNNGGLLAPSSALLGGLAVTTATEDYFFVQGGTGASGSLTISGLNPGRLYSLRFFGTRQEAQARRTTYTVTAGSGAFAATLQTSGAAIGDGGYNGNNDKTVALGGIQSGPTGRVDVRVAVAEGGFAYLGILEIIEGAATPPIEVTLTNVIDRWEAQDALDPVEPGAVLFVGSSSIRRWEALARDFADYRIVQRGFGGTRFSEINPLIDRIVLPYRPSAIVVFAGTNDIRTEGKTGAQVFAGYQEFVSKVRAVLPEVPIGYIAITRAPVYYGNATHDRHLLVANQLIKEHCESDPTLNLHFFDTATYFDELRAENLATWNSYFPDGLHLTPAGYEKWTEIIRPLLAAIVPPNKTYAANPAALQDGEKLFFDFGPSQSSVGDPTAGADANGNHWNNWHLTNGGGLVNSGEHLAGLVRSTGTGTGLRMTITGGFEVNGKTSFGGLLSPSPSLLGELAVATATQDFFYSHSNIDDLPGGFMLEGLNPALAYEFRFFGSRTEAQNRTTRYIVRGANEAQADLQTSGAGIGSTGGHGNDDEIAVVSGARPDAFGQLFVDLDRLAGAFAYVNAMQITASTPPSTASAYETWRAGHFTAEELADPALEETLWGADADPDHDGRSNLSEYAFLTTPRQPDTDRLESAHQSTGDGEQLSLTYQKNLAATDLIYQAQVSEDLATWSPLEDALVSTGEGVEIRQATVTLAPPVRRQFIRLHVTLEATP